MFCYLFFQCTFLLCQGVQLTLCIFLQICYFLIYCCNLYLQLLCHIQIQTVQCFQLLFLQIRLFFIQAVRFCLCASFFFDLYKEVIQPCDVLIYCVLHGTLVCILFYLSCKNGRFLDSCQDIGSGRFIFHSVCLALDQELKFTSHRIYICQILFYDIFQCRMGGILSRLSLIQCTFPLG